MTQADPTTDRLLVGNCLDTLKTLADASIDSIVTDPPYELGFMGKAWDASGIAYQVQLWAECLRVLKPGGYLLAFGGTRTYHRMAVAIEDAGFEIRDSIHWTYGSGFPKSLNVSKAIDKAAKAERKMIKQVKRTGKEAGTYGAFAGNNIETAPATKAAKQWDGWGTALKPSHEPIVVARKPLDGTVADNVQQHGTGAINIDASRIGSGGGAQRGPGDIGEDAETNSIYGKGLGLGNAAPRIEGLGRFPANTLLTHNHDCKQISTLIEDMPEQVAGQATIGTFKRGHMVTPAKTVTSAVWSCTPNCPIELLDQQSGPAGASAPASGPSYSGPSKSGSMAGAFKGNGDAIPAFHDDKGGASRFFHNSQWSQADDLTPFIYQAKPGKKERNAGLDSLPEQANKFGNQRNGEDLGNGSVNDKFTTEPSKNFHPTVKPVELIRYLIKMVTPPKGTVLDPFLGSGTTAVAAILEGFDWKGCELTEDYVPIIKGRVAWAHKQKKAPGTQSP
jgi:site-specific DNA-methyltransferase (adenine-specific)